MTISNSFNVNYIEISFRTCCETIKIRRSMRLLISQAKDVLKFALNRHKDIPQIEQLKLWMEKNGKKNRLGSFRVRGCRNEFFGLPVRLFQALIN